MHVDRSSCLKHCEVCTLPERNGSAPLETEGRKKGREMPFRILLKNINNTFCAVKIEQESVKREREGESKKQSEKARSL